MNKINKETAIYDIKDLSFLKKMVLGLQHTFTMFGATVLVPILTGLDISVALFMAGISTLLFHFITKGKMPVFLGSSFAFIAPILSVVLLKTGSSVEALKAAGETEKLSHGLAYAQGGLVIAGLVYLILAVLIYFFSAEKVLSFFPPIVTGPIIIVIGIKLAPVAIDMASSNYLIALVSFLIVMILSVYSKGFLKIIPVICGMIGGYIFAAITGNVDFTPILQAKVFGLPHFQLAKFDFSSIMIVAPIALATVIEHMGDVAAISATVGENYMKDPGLHRTLLGDGVCTSISAMFGGPANTTYSENTGVLALTRIFDPRVMRIAACFAMLLGLMPVLGGVISSIPVAVIGGISIILFGMIASIGIRTLIENQVDLTKSRNLILAAVILVLGLGGAVIQIGSFKFEGMALAAIIGIVLNKIMPQGK